MRFSDEKIRAIRSGSGTDRLPDRRPFGGLRSDLVSSELWVLEHSSFRPGKVLNLLAAAVFRDIAGRLLSSFRQKASAALREVGPAQVDHCQPVRFRAEQSSGLELLNESSR